MALRSTVRASTIPSNRSSGGVAAHVDPGTGRSSRAARKDPRSSREEPRADGTDRASPSSRPQNRSAFVLTSSTPDTPDHRRTRSRTGCSQRVPWLSLRHTGPLQAVHSLLAPPQQVEQHGLPAAGLPDERHPVQPPFGGGTPNHVVEGCQLVLAAHDPVLPGDHPRAQRLELEDLDGRPHALELQASQRGPRGDAGGVAEDARVHDERPWRGAAHQSRGQVDVGAVAAEADLHRGPDQPAERGAHRRPGTEHHRALRPQGQQESQGPLDVPREGDRSAPVEQDHPPLLGALHLVQHATVGLDEPEDVTDESADVFDRRLLAPARGRR